MTRCEIVAVTNLSDVVGDHCENVAAGQCSDCGTPICELHAETCQIYGEVFCPSCLSFHGATHPKPATAEPEELEWKKRKSA